MRSIVNRTDKGAIEPWYELEAINDTDENQVGILEQNKSRLQDEQILVVAKLSQHKIAIVKKLTTDYETVPYP